MIFTETRLPGAYTIDLEPIEDERGFFARQWCEQEFEQHGLTTTVSQTSVAFNSSKGTLRGMHWQVAPHAEVKLVRCVRGSFYDVALDLETGKWFGTTLSADNRRMLYVPEGCAHGFLTLEDDTEALYLTTSYWSPEHERGVRWDDPALGIDWGARDPIISTRDQQNPPLAAIPAAELPT